MTKGASLEIQGPGKLDVDAGMIGLIFYEDYHRAIFIPEGTDANVEINGEVEIVDAVISEKYGYGGVIAAYSGTVNLNGKVKISVSLNGELENQFSAEAIYVGEGAKVNIDGANFEGYRGKRASIAYVEPDGEFTFRNGSVSKYSVYGGHNYAFYGAGAGRDDKKSSMITLENIKFEKSKKLGIQYVIYVGLYGTLKTKNLEFNGDFPEHYYNATSTSVVIEE